MRRSLVRLAVLLLTVLVAGTLLAGCARPRPGSEPRSHRDDPEAVWTRTIGTGTAIPVRFVELRTGADPGLDALLPPWALARLGTYDPPRPGHGERRYATVLTGCQERSTPRLRIEAGTPRAYFPDPSRTECYAAEHTVAVFDVSPDVAARLDGSGVAG